MSTDRWVILLAGAATLGALAPSRGALAAGVAVGLVAAAGRWRLLGCVAVALLVSGLAQRSLDGLDGLGSGSIAADVTLLSDPAPHFDGIRVDVRWGHRRLEAVAEGVAAAALEPRLAGEVVTLRGTVRPADEAQPWRLARHIAGELRILRVDGWHPGDPSTRVANALRRTLVSGASPLDERARSLYTGLVIGDDRHQPDDLADAFLGAGLTHLLAVSGQNVAFALALVGPALRRLRLWPRLATTVGVITLFGVMTRFEPSVLRASAMAALAATIAMAGQPASRLRIVGLAVTGLLFVDPLLVRSAGFQLSVAAAVAIVVLAPRLTSVLPGPRWLREAAGVTLAAQLGVAPVLLATFGPIPVASLPANLLCVPVAGLVMVWGLTGGLLAGAVGEPVASIVHGPTRLALGWLDLVAQRSAHAPLGVLGLGQVAALALGLGGAVVGHRHSIVRWVGGVLAVAAVASAVVVAQAPPPLRTALAPGVVRWHARDVDVVVIGGVGGRAPLGGPRVLEALRRGGVGTIDLLVVADPAVPAEVVEVVLRAHPARSIVTHRDGTATIDVDGLTVRVVAVAGRLVVDAVPRGP